MNTKGKQRERWKLRQALREKAPQILGVKGEIIPTEEPANKD